MHLIVDGTYQNSILASDPELLEKWVLDLVSFIKMRAIGGPHTLTYEGTPPGITSVVILAESHISVHTDTELGLVCVDVFSCKEFAEEETKNKIIADFSIKDPVVYMLPRWKRS